MYKILLFIFLNSLLFSDVIKYNKEYYAVNYQCYNDLLEVTIYKVEDILDNNDSISYIIYEQNNYCMNSKGKYNKENKFNKGNIYHYIKKYNKDIKDVE